MKMDLETLLNPLSEEGKWFFLSQLKEKGFDCSKYNSILEQGYVEPEHVDGNAEMKAFVEEINATPISEKIIDGVILLNEKDSSKIVKGREYLSVEGFVLLGGEDSSSPVKGRNYLRLELNGIDGQAAYLDLSKYKETIAICERFKDYNNAALISEIFGNLDDALSFYEKARNFLAARRTAVKLGHFDKAMLYAEKTGYFEIAEEYAAKINDKDKEELYKQIADLTCRPIKRTRPEVKVVSGIKAF